MFVGRALYGWGTREFKPEDAKTEDARSEFVEDACKKSRPGPGECPILELHSRWHEIRKSDRRAYNPARSAFWRVIRLLSETRNASKEIQAPWHSTIHWTNLYKVNPASTGNPGAVLRLAQQQACIGMLKCEIDIKKPDAVVFLTGWGWARPFLTDMKIVNSTDNSGAILEAHGRLISDSRAIPFVVVPHPQGKRGQAILSAVLDGIGLVCA